MHTKEISFEPARFAQYLYLYSTQKLQETRCHLRSKCRTCQIQLIQIKTFSLEEYDLTNKKSLLLADKILEELKRDPYTYIHKPNVEFANFRVLKLIDVPSVLVESGFISNPDDAKRLSGKPGRRMIARGIFKGILNYLKQENPKNTIMQDKPKSLTYIIQKGDLLSEIAIRFGVTVDELISQNKINPKRIYPGQKIKINI